MEQASSGLTIDWRLLLLQAGNFLVLLGILTWLVWKPLIQMIDDRRRLIVEGIAAAQAQKAALAAAEEERAKLLAEARVQVTELLAQAREQLAAEQATNHREFVSERERARTTLAKELEGRRAQMDHELRESVSQLVAQAVTKILGETAEDKTLAPAIAKALKDLQ